MGFGVNAGSNLHWILNASTTYGGVVGGAHAWNNAATAVGGVDVSDGAWHHVAIVRAGAFVYLWVDGELDTTGVSTVDFANAAALSIGTYAAGSNGNYAGQIDEFRISTEARYMVGFDAQDPTALPDPIANQTPDADTLLLMHFDGDASDASSYGRVAIAFGDPEYREGEGYVGTHALRLDGGDYLVIPQSTDFDFSSSAFTIEFWSRSVRSELDGGFWPRVFGFGTNASSRLHLFTEVDGSYGSVQGAVHAWNAAQGAVGTTPIHDGDWHHVAIQGTGTDLEVYVDGTLEASVAQPALTNDSALYIGAYGDGATGRWVGYIDELHISASARYSDGFDPEARTEVCNGVDDDLDGATDESNVCRCLTGEYRSSTYHACREPVSWYDAQEACVARGSSLVELDSHWEDLEIQDRLFTTWPDRTWWTSGNDLDTEGTFHLASGGRMFFANWYSGQPDNANGNQHCVGVAPQGSGWFDMACEREMPFVCETPL
jgi:hypothetical protein